MILAPQEQGCATGLLPPPDEPTGCLPTRPCKILTTKYKEAFTREGKQKARLQIETDQKAVSPT